MNKNTIKAGGDMSSEILRDGIFNEGTVHFFEEGEVGKHET